MADTGYLPKEKLKDLLTELSKSAQVFAPCQEDDTVLFRAYGPDKNICLERPANAPPKAVIYPQSEPLFSFQFKKNPDEPQKMGIELEVKTKYPETVIFGARPCDAKGFTVIDRVFINTDTPDPYYKGRREKTTVVTMACPEPSAGCFCTAVGGGPAHKEGSDVMITEVQKGYFVEAVTEKGKALLKGAGVQDGAAFEKEALDIQARAHSAVERPFKTDKLPVINTVLLNSEEFWVESMDKCLSCGACTFLCPTCYCFNITDEQGIDKGERIRSWDACMFQHFTLETSGHNPRPRKNNRFRNRVGHKFVWYPEKYEGVIACCGCGRCIRYCPVSVDIREIVANLEDANLPKTGGVEK